MLGVGSSSPFALTSTEEERLAERLRAPSRRTAQRLGHAGHVLPALSADVDPSAVVCASRRAGEQWFVFEQPERGRFALAGLGEAIALRASGGERFATVSGRWRAISARL